MSNSIKIDLCDDALKKSKKKYKSIVFEISVHYYSIC